MAENLILKSYRGSEIISNMLTVAELRIACRLSPELHHNMLLASTPHGSAISDAPTSGSLSVRYISRRSSLGASTNIPGF